MDYNNNFSNNDQVQYNNQYYQQPMQGAQYQQQMQNPQYQQAYQNNGYQAAPKQPTNVSQDVKYNQYGMRWFLFMVWGYLIYGIINNITSAITLFKLGNDFDGLDKIKSVFIIQALLAVGIAFLCYYTRRLLMNFSVSAPKFVLASVAAPLVSVVIYIIQICTVLEAELEDAIEFIGLYLTNGESWTVWVYMICYGALIYGNYVYFNNRKHLFNNNMKISLF